MAEIEEKKRGLSVGRSRNRRPFRFPSDILSKIFEEWSLDKLGAWFEPMDFKIIFCVSRSLNSEKLKTMLLSSYFENIIGFKLQNKHAFDSWFCEVGLDCCLQMMSLTAKFCREAKRRSVLVAAGGCHSLVSVHGKLFAAGRGKFGATGSGSRRNSPTFQEISLGTVASMGPFPRNICSRVVQISAGDAHTLFLTQTGSVLSCGQGDHGRLGHGDDLHQLKPKEIAFFHGKFIASVSAGEAHSLALSIHGLVYSWGWGFDGLSFSGGYEDKHTPSQVDFPKITPEISKNVKICAIYAGYGISVCCTNQNDLLYTGAYGKVGFKGVDARCLKIPPGPSGEKINVAQITVSHPANEQGSVISSRTDDGNVFVWKILPKNVEAIWETQYSIEGTWLFDSKRQQKVVDICGTPGCRLLALNEDGKIVNIMLESAFLTSRELQFMGGGGLGRTGCDSAVAVSTSPNGLPGKWNCVVGLLSEMIVSCGDNNQYGQLGNGRVLVSSAFSPTILQTCKAISNQN